MNENRPQESAAVALDLPQSLAGVLLDVGGTLWPGQPALPGTLEEARATRLHRVFPKLPKQQAHYIAQELQSEANSEALSLIQDTYSLIEKVLRHHHIRFARIDVERVREAMYVPAKHYVTLFLGAQELLCAIRDCQLGCAVVSNTSWRTADDYRRDFRALGVSRFIDVIVSSVDLGVRKPHPAMFERAITALGTVPGACLMIGDSERNDMAPARRLGLATIQVAVDRPLPIQTSALYVLSSLSAVADLLSLWRAHSNR